MKLENFVWGPIEPAMKEIITREFFIDKECMYEKFNKVKEGDVVMDVGSSCGPFPYKIKDRNIRKLYCVEPGITQLGALRKNIEGLDYEIIDKAIGDSNSTTNTYVYGDKNKLADVKSVKFNTLIKEFSIKRIDFLKTDCEGGEYSIFNIENLFWIKDNVNFVVGEWHLNNTELKQKFREFRDLYLKLFPDHYVYSIDGVDIKWDLWNDHFIEYYTEVIIHININKNN